MSPRKICVITGSRAEYGLLRPTLFLLQQNSEVDLSLIVTGTHLSHDHGYTVQEIQKDGFNIFSQADLKLTLDNEAPAMEMGFALSKIAFDLQQLKPDIVLVTGDRYEMAAGAMAAAMLRIPIAHIGGGEQTEGAIDESLRHVITKLSYWHFTSSDKYRNTVIDLGESPDRAYNVGAPGIDNLTGLMTWEECDAIIKSDKVWETRPENDKIILFSWHPETLGDSRLSEVLAALDEIKNATIIISGANADEGGGIINQQLMQYASTREGVLFRKSFPTHLWLSLMANADVVVGNSSAGVIEAPALGIPSINIGTRQKGRIKPRTVFCVDASHLGIAMAITAVLSGQMDFMPYSLFGTPGSVAPKIVDHLLKVEIPAMPIKRLYV